MELWALAITLLSAFFPQVLVAFDLLWGDNNHVNVDGYVYCPYSPAFPEHRSKVEENWPENLIGTVKPSSATLNSVAIGYRLAKGAHVHLYDDDVISDDLLNSTTTNESGYFHVIGYEVETNGINPYLCVVYDCEQPLPGIEVITVKWYVPLKKAGNSVQSVIVPGYEGYQWDEC